MASKTTNFNLHKIDLTDAPPDITVLNQNWDKIDTELKKKYDPNNKPTASDVGARPNTWMPTAADVGAVKADSLGTYTDISLTVAGLVKGFFDERIRWGTFHAAFLSDLPPSTKDWDNGIEFRVLGGYWVEVTITAHNHSKWTRLLDTNSTTWKTEWNAVLHTGNKDQIFTYGTSDLTAGSSTLETGKLYFVYE